MKTEAAILAICFFLVSGCGNKEAPGDRAPAAAPEISVADSPSAAPVKEGSPPEKIVEIREKMFIAQTNEIYLNAEDYLGKTIKLEGLFKWEEYENRKHCFVLRYGPGCCGYDGNAGFEVAWEGPGKRLPEYPLPDDWVEAAGVLKAYEKDGYSYLYIALSSLRVLEARGAEFVTQ
jgi:uncharacterized membrane protein YcgQ (UPF0703/DUF1980 family)